MKKLNVGDRVRMIETGQYSFDRIGNTGTVIGFASDKLLEITVDGEDYPVFGNGWTYWVENENWEVIEEESKMAKFKVGDKVRLVKKYLYSFEKIGMVGEVVMDSGYSTLSITIKDSGDPEFWWTYPAHDGNWEVVEEESKLRVTSKVEPMCIYSFDSVEDMRTFLKIADQDGFDVDSCEYGIQEHGSETRFRVNNYKSISYGTYAYDTPRFPEYERVQFKVEEEKEMPKCKFKVGDLIKGNDPDFYTITTDRMTKAIVRKVEESTIEVEVLEHLEHSSYVGLKYTVREQYFDFYEEPKLVQNEKPKTTVLKLGEYKIVFNGDTTVVTDGTRKGVAKRHPDDEYDAVVGLQVAIERFNGGTRKPKIGDKVRVLKVDGNSRYGRHSYSIGEIVTVTDTPYGGKDTDIGCRNKGVWGKGECSMYQTLIAGEYEVLG